MSSGPTKDEILDVLPKELTDNVVTQKDREKYSHILRKFLRLVLPLLYEFLFKVI